eukprot:11446200-Alexandrium_andersonii.AAC.1
MPIAAGCLGLRFCTTASSASCMAFGTSSSVTFSASRTQMHLSKATPTKCSRRSFRSTSFQKILG